MTHRIDRVTLVWLALLAATFASSTLGLEHHGPSRLVAATLVAIAYVKLRLVVMHFMEVRAAPQALRLALEAYLVVTGTALIVLQLAA